MDYEKIGNALASALHRARHAEREFNEDGQLLALWAILRHLDQLAAECGIVEGLQLRHEALPLGSEAVSTVAELEDELGEEAELDAAFERAQAFEGLRDLVKESLIVQRENLELQREALAFLRATLLPKELREEERVGSGEEA